MVRKEAPGVGLGRLLLAAALLVSAAPAAVPAAAEFSLENGMAPMADFSDGTFTMRARPEFRRPDGYLALAFGSPKSPSNYYLIVTATGMKLWRLDGGGKRRLLDAERFQLAEGQEISLKFAVKGRTYYAEIAGYPPLVAENEASFKGRLVLRAAGAKVAYEDPVVEIDRRSL